MLEGHHDRQPADEDEPGDVDPHHRAEPVEPVGQRAGLQREEQPGEAGGQGHAGDRARRAGDAQGEEGERDLEDAVGQVRQRGRREQLPVGRTEGHGAHRARMATVIGKSQSLCRRRYAGLSRPARSTSSGRPRWPSTRRSGTRCACGSCGSASTSPAPTASSPTGSTRTRRRCSTTCARSSSTASSRSSRPVWASGARGRSRTRRPGSRGTSPTTRCPPTTRLASVVAMIDVLRAEVLEAGPAASATSAGSAWCSARRARRSCRTVCGSWPRSSSERSPEPDGERLGLFIALHERE